MDKNLKSYLETLVDLEKNAYMQSQLLNNLRNRIDRLGKPIVYQKPQKKEADFLSNLQIGVVGTAFVGAILGAIVGLVNSDGLFDAIDKVIGTGIQWLLYGLGAGVVVGIILHIYECHANKNDYNIDYLNYVSSTENDNIRVNKEKEQIKQLQAISSATIQKQAATNALLQQYYDIGVIPPEYQNIIAVCSIFGYLEKGICDKLKGYDGAFAQYQMDLRFKRLEDKLDAVLASLEQIKENQYVLYNAITQVNQNVTTLINKTERQLHLMEKLDNKMDIMNYYQQQTLVENRYQSYLQTYTVLKLKEYNER